MHANAYQAFVFLVFLILCICQCWSKSIMMQKVINGEQPTTDSNDSALDDSDKNGDDVAPPKHIDGLKISRDGSINSNFHKEVFLGEDVDNFQNGNYQLKDQKRKLKEIFVLIDQNKDEFVEVNELSNWVMLKTKEHFDEARHDNKDKFQKLDSNHDGILTWNEYLVEFLGNKKYDRDEVAKKLANKTQITVNQKLKDEIDELKDKWSEVASVENLNELNESQFLDFQHPELSTAMLEMMISDFLHDLDIDGDEILTVHEFMAISSDVDANQVDEEWASRRREEFLDVIDLDHDGVATKEEIQKYLDPLSESMAEQEARQLISFGDDDGNGKLSLDELLENSEFYTGSKLYNYAKSIHEEF